MNTANAEARAATLVVAPANEVLSLATLPGYVPYSASTPVDSAAAASAPSNVARGSRIRSASSRYLARRRLAIHALQHPILSHAAAEGVMRQMVRHRRKDELAVVRGSCVQGATRPWNDTGSCFCCKFQS